MGLSPNVNALSLNSYSFLNIDGHGYSLSLTMRNVNIVHFGIACENSYYSTSGGAIVLGDLSQVLFSSVKFFGNYGCYGGAVYVQLHVYSLAFTDCVFDSNMADTWSYRIY